MDYLQHPLIPQPSCGVCPRQKQKATICHAITDAGDQPSNFVEVQNSRLSFANRHQTPQPPDLAKRDRSISAGRARTRQPPAQRDRNAIAAMIKSAAFISVFPMIHHDQPFQTDDGDSGTSRRGWVLGKGDDGVVGAGVSVCGAKVASRHFIPACSWQSAN